MARRAAGSDRDLLNAFWTEPVERTVLPNGLTLLVKPDRSAALASVQVWVRTGSIHEGEHLGAGLSHFLEHMLFKGTERRQGREISATVQANGGYINAYTTFDRTVYYIDIPSERVEVAVDLLADAVLHSTLPAEEVEKERQVILREIAMTRDDPDGRLWEALFATAFREHPYRQPVIGHRDVFAATTREALLGYYRARYVPNNMVVVIAGDVEPTAARALVEAHFGAAPRSRLAPVLVPAEPAQLGPRTLRHREKVEVVRSILSWPVPGMADPHAPVLDTLAAVLGGGDSSLLWQEIRERRRLVHTIDASCWNPGSCGLFCISFTCDAGGRDKAEAAILGYLSTLGKTGSFSPADVRKAIRQSVVAEINSHKTMSGQAARLGVAEVVVGDLEFGRAYFERLSRVRAPDLSSAIRAHLDPDRLVRVSSEPESAPAQSTGARVPGSDRGDFEVEVLPNGARIVFQVDRRLPNVHMRLLTHAGPVCEEPGVRGSSALLATLLTKDTRRRSAAEVARRIESVGGYFSAFAGENTLGIAAEVLPPDVPLALDVLGEGAFGAAFKAATLEKEREAQLSALREESDDVVASARRILRQRFFGAHPMAVSAHGTAEGVKATQRGDLVRLWGRLAVGPGTVLSVAGDIEPRVLLPRLRRLMAALPRGEAPGAGARFAAPPAQEPLVVRQPREQAVIMQAYPGPLLGDPDYYVGEVADEVFSGMASHLFERVREQKGLAYFVRSARITGRSASMFCFLAGTQPGKEDEVGEEIEREIDRMAAGQVSEAELRRCQARLKAGQRKSLQTNATRALVAGIDVLQGRSANFWKRYDELVDAVTIAELATFAKRHLDGRFRTRVVVRP
jgi:zinc protease